jgi:ribosomal protein S18 acetylase RimI-like enzyme
MAAKATLRIRKARKQDLEAIQTLNYSLFLMDSRYDQALNKQWPHQKAGIEYFQDRIAGKHGVCLVAEVNNRVVGYLIGSFYDYVPPFRPVKKTELDNMIVEDKYRGRGIGTKLVQAFLKWSRAQGAQKALVVAYASNNKAISFYHSGGFKPLELKLEADL